VPFPLGFASEYCRPARSNEKGGVEMELGWFRRNWRVPVPGSKDLASFDAWLYARCGEAQQHLIIGRKVIAEVVREEQPHLLPLVPETFGIFGNHSSSDRGFCVAAVPGHPNQSQLRRVSNRQNWNCPQPIN
jgi:hypothetical protein